MFVITADQVGSRRDPDRTTAMVEELGARFSHRLLLPVDQTAGDEVQLVTDSAETALSIVLDTTRTDRWSVGLGVGDVRRPLPDAARKATGTAFFAARDAVAAAKRADARFALRASPLVEHPNADDVEPLIRLLLMLRERRSEAGWEAVDLAETGQQQKEIAAELGISRAAVSMRLRTAGWRVEVEAVPALTRLLGELDRASSHVVAD